jgi:restriction system protein
MSRRTSSSFNKLLISSARSAARAQRQAEVRRKQLERERERAYKQNVRLAALRAKEQKAQYYLSMQGDVEKSNLELRNQITQLENLLEDAFRNKLTADFVVLKKFEPMEGFMPPQEVSTPLTPPNRNDYISSVQKPFFLLTIFPGVTEKYQQELQQANIAFEKAYNYYADLEQKRKSEYDKLASAYQKKKDAYEKDQAKYNNDIDQLVEAFAKGDPYAIKVFFTLLLDASEYPENFPQDYQLAYIPDSKELVIEYLLPNTSVVPNISEFKYVKTKDVIEEKPRKQTEIKSLYQEIVSSICLRTIYEVFNADVHNFISVVDFNGYVETIDPATGKDIKPYLISVRVTKDRFNEIDLQRIDKRACLRNLGAQVSSRPDEMQAVKPVIDFNMVDKRFVDQSDILSDIESRPNLMDLNPFEFENLVSNLFTRMGLDTKQTRSSKDGGVDAVAFDLRPVLGGKVVIQAKRYKHPVGVSAVRDLYGTMMNEGANKGILVTTSSYGPDAYDFAKDKPIELIDGGGLLYLLEQNGVQARIVFPVEG